MFWYHDFVRLPATCLVSSYLNYRHTFMAKLCCTMFNFDIFVYSNEYVCLCVSFRASSYQNYLFFSIHEMHVSNTAGIRQCWSSHKIHLYSSLKWPWPGSQQNRDIKTFGSKASVVRIPTPTNWSTRFLVKIYIYIHLTKILINQLVGGRDPII